MRSILTMIAVVLSIVNLHKQMSELIHSFQNIFFSYQREMNQMKGGQIVYLIEFAFPIRSFP